MREEKSEDMPETPHSSNRQKTVAIISKPGRPELSEVLPALEKWLRERNYAVVTDQESTAYFSPSNVIARSELAMRSPHGQFRSEEHTSELQSPDHLVCRLLLEKKKTY